VFVVLHFGGGITRKEKRPAYMYEACFYQLAVNAVSLEDLFMSCSEFVVIWKSGKGLFTVHLALVITLYLRFVWTRDRCEARHVRGSECV